VIGSQRSRSGSPADGERPFASPLARRLAKEAGLDLAKVQGSGPHGRIVEKDIEAAKAGGGAKAAPRPRRHRPAPKLLVRRSLPGMSDEAVKKLFAPGSYEEVPHDGMRKTIARRLSRPSRRSRIST
jgi:pyruvate dehydrogenase E2 component (dihydrolipoamide acetyltransferase)